MRKDLASRRWFPVPASSPVPSPVPPHPNPTPRANVIVTGPDLVSVSVSLARFRSRLCTPAHRLVRNVFVLENVIGTRSAHY